MNHDFWIPKYKYQYVEYLQRHYPVNKLGIRINWNYKKLEQLRAIYIKLREKGSVINEEKKVTTNISDSVSRVHGSRQFESSFH